MSLTEQITQHLNSSQVQDSRQESLQTTFSLPNGSMTCDLTAVDSMACAFRSLSVKSSRLSDTTIEQLKEICDQLVQRLNYLLEPLGVLEADEESCVVQMRSRDPQKREDVRSYYELLACRGGEIGLRRYNKEAGSVRELAATTVTHEVLIRLANDMVSVL